jgi:hypothetical protein
VLVLAQARAQARAPVQAAEPVQVEPVLVRLAAPEQAVR